MVWRLSIVEVESSKSSYKEEFCELLEQVDVRRIGSSCLCCLKLQVDDAEIIWLKKLEGKGTRICIADGRLA